MITSESMKSKSEKLKIRGRVIMGIGSGIKRVISEAEWLEIRCDWL